ncbi:hypothetical protein CLOSCI_02128 [[Clostridium] scindens ATCC 35704]|nr:hypothetical protein CLOSCI_02128 [[Clostridium] scindens ATCC 35704]
MDRLYRNYNLLTAYENESGGLYMKDNMFCLAGKVSIPVEKRNEMNKYVLEIMDKCGIRKTVEMTVAGKKVTVAAPARPNTDGIVLFDYSIFEKKKRKISQYDLNTCELYVEDPGYNEFGVVMNMIMVLQEAFTNGGCYFIKSGKLYDVEIYLLLIQGVLGEKVTLPGRIRMSEVYLFFRNSEEYKDITYTDLLEDYSDKYGRLDIEQLLAVFEIENKKIIIPEEGKISCRNEIKSANSCSRIEYAYRVFRGIKETEKTAMKSFLAELLNADFAKRKELSARQDEKGIIAELSLYVLPVRLVFAYTQDVDLDFWETWDSLGTKGYSDITWEADSKDDESDFQKFPFYKAIQRKNEDEFLEFWDGGNLLLSQNMKECIRYWEEQMNDICVPSVISVENLLTNIITRLERSYCRYVDEKFVAEFMEHGSEINYQKALILIQRLLDKEQEYFPELTGEQAEEWIIKDSRDNFDYIEISALVSLMTNKKQRNIIFGF